MSGQPVGPLANVYWRGIGDDHVLVTLGDSTFPKSTYRTIMATTGEFMSDVDPRVWPIIREELVGRVEGRNHFVPLPELLT